MKNKADFLELLANNIRKHRELKRFSQESFSKYIKIARRNYGDIELGKVNPSIIILMKIALGLDVPLVQLIPGDFSLEDLIESSI